MGADHRGHRVRWVSGVPRGLPASAGHLGRRASVVIRVPPVRWASGGRRAFPASAGHLGRPERRVPAGSGGRAGSPGAAGYARINGAVRREG